MSKLPAALHEKLFAKESDNFTSDDAMMKEYVNHHFAGGLAPRDAAILRVNLTSILHDLERRKKGLVVIANNNNDSNSSATTGGILDSTGEDAAVKSEEEVKAEFMKKLKSLEIDLKLVVDDTTKFLEKKL